jgi:hypothetical protein
MQRISMFKLFYFMEIFTVVHLVKVLVITGKELRLEVNAIANPGKN